MELTLTTRWIVHKCDQQTREITEGMAIEYYGNGVDNSSSGAIKERDGYYFIEWEDISADTPIDGSEESNKILKDCGFAF